MFKVKKLFVLAIVSMLTIAAFAQSSEKVSEIIKADKATFGQAAYLVTAACGELGDNDGFDEALNVLKRKRIVSYSVNADDNINLKGLSWLCAYAWQIDGSLMLKVFNSPRYTFRQMKADEVISSAADPMDVPDGRGLLAVITDCIGKYQVKGE